MGKRMLFLFLTICGLFLPANSCRSKSTDKSSATVDDTEKLSKSITEISVKRIAENRAIDAKNPPVIIDIIEARKNVKPIRYSQFGKKIRHLKLSHPFDSTFFENARVFYTSHYIIAMAERGLALFNEKGEFVELLCTNRKKYEKTDEGYVTISPNIKKNYRGATGIPLVTSDRIYYQFIDMPNEKGFLIEYTPGAGTNGTFNFETTDTVKQFYKGKVLSEIPPTFRFDDLMGRTSSVLPVDTQYFAYHEDKIASSQSGNFLTICTTKGDTISQFQDFDPFMPQGIYRNPETNTLYRLNGKLHIRQCYNDTIYRLTAPNAITPKYILNFHRKNITEAKEGLSASVDLKERFVIENIKETEKFLWIFYTQNYECPDTAENNTLKYNLFVYNKETKQGSHAYLDEQAYIPSLSKNSPLPSVWPQAPQKGLINDLDETSAYWNVRQAENNIYIPIMGKVFKELNKNAVNYSDNDIIITIIE